MKINFLDTFYYKNYNLYKKTRNFLDAYILYKYLNFNKNVNNFLEIGCHKGAIFSLVAEISQPKQIVLIDPDMDLLTNTVPKSMLKNTILKNVKADDVDWRFMNNMDLISIDGDYNQPNPSNDVKNCLTIAHDNTVIMLDDYAYKDMNVTRQLLKDNGWTAWLKLDQGEWWSKQTLMPFINHILTTNEITNFARIYKGFDDDCNWRISTPQAIYDNIKIIEKYIK